MSGVSRSSYTPEIRIIRLMCTGRIDLSFLIRAFIKGADGVIIGACWPGECHYVTQGNFDALGNVLLMKKIMKHAGLFPERIKIEWIAASEGMRFGEVMDEFSVELEKLGHFAEGEGADEDRLKVKLEAAMKLVPYIKLVERERLRVPEKSVEAYNRVYEGGDADRMFDELIAGKLALGEILTLLEKKPMSTAGISEALGMGPSEVARHLNASSRQGLVVYDTETNCYALARPEREAVHG